MEKMIDGKMIAEMFGMGDLYDMSSMSNDSEKEIIEESSEDIL